MQSAYADGVSSWGATASDAPVSVCANFNNPTCANRYLQILVINSIFFIFMIEVLYIFHLMIVVLQCCNVVTSTLLVMFTQEPTVLKYLNNERRYK